MGKKGFTLTELLAVIVILSVISLIVVPVVVNVISSSKDIAYEQQIKFIVGSANNWLTENAVLLSKTEKNCITLSTLKESGYFNSSDIKDPKTGENLNGFVIFTYNDEYNQFDISYADTCE